MSDCCDNKKTKLRDNCCDETSGGYVTAYCNSGVGATPISITSIPEFLSDVMQFFMYRFLISK